VHAADEVIGGIPFSILYGYLSQKDAKKMCLVDTLNAFVDAFNSRRAMTQKINSATIIQSLYRGFSARKLIKSKA
jgi:hypothetical protein